MHVMEYSTFLVSILIQWYPPKRTHLGSAANRALTRTVPLQIVAEKGNKVNKNTSYFCQECRKRHITSTSHYRHT